MKHKHTKALSFLLTLALLVGLLPWTVLPARAEVAHGISYIDANGGAQTASEETVVSSEMAGYSNNLFASEYNWLYVQSNVTLENASNSGDVGTMNLILGDGATLTINGSLRFTGNTSLNIYCQSGGTGRLVINGTSSSNPLLSLGNNTLTINGGTVSVTNSGEVGNNALTGNLVMNRGVASFNGGGFGYGIEGPANGTVVFNGGSLTVTGGNDGIRDAAVTLSHKNSTDRVEVSSYSYSTVTIADGKYFKDSEGNIYSGTLISTPEVSSDGNTLQPAYPHTITVDSGISNGTVAVDRSLAESGNTVTLTATPDEGYQLDTVTVSKSNSDTVETSGSGNSRTFTMPDENVTVTATFTELPATAPTITTQPSSLNLTYGYTSGNVLTVAASGASGHTLSYQWYSNTTNSNSGGTLISGATSASYNVPTGKSARTTVYYYCVVTAARTDNGEAATTTSNVATVMVNKADVTGAPSYETITESGKTLEDANLTAGSLTPAGGEIHWTDADGEVIAEPNTVNVEQGKAYGWTYMLDNVNYNVKKGSVTLWAKPAPAPTPTPTPTPTPASGGDDFGGSGSGGSSGDASGKTPTANTTTTNPDGSTTESTSKTTETKNADGSTTAKTTETATTTGADGSKTETKSESATTTKENADGGTTATTKATEKSTMTDANGAKTVTETKTETTETLDRNGNGTVEGTTTETVTDASGKVLETTVTESKGTVATDENGTKTTTTTNTATTTDADGNVTTTVTVEEKAETKDGTVTAVVKDENGNVLTADANVSKQAVEDAQKAGAPVQLPMEVAPATAENAANAAAVAITMPAASTSGSVAKMPRVEIEVPKSGPGIIVMIRNALGKLIPVKECREGSVILPVSGSCEVVIVDNTKTFADVRENDWFRDNVTFVTAREIFNGAGDGMFAPDAAMTRGMLAQALYNFDRSAAPNSAYAFADAAGMWYADAASWAASVGVVTGTDKGFEGEANVTREQVATMFYRYAKLCGYNVSASGDISAHGDASDVSDWAVDAMRWAVGAGLIQGADGKLAPQAPATRAQLAAIMQRFIENVVK